MPLDHVRFCAHKYLKNSYGFRATATRPDLAGQAGRLIETAATSDPGAVIGVQTVAENSDEIAFAVTENGLYMADLAKFVPYASIVATRSDYQDKQDFRAVDLELDDGSIARLKVESGRGKLRDAFAVSSWGSCCVDLDRATRLTDHHPADARAGGLVDSWPPQQPGLWSQIKGFDL